jgi:uncharacterized protein
MKNHKDACDIGVGLRAQHYPYLENRPQTTLKWFEAISENYMDSEGRPLHMLELIRNDYPIALHGVSLSIGAIQPVNDKYLKNLKKLIERINPVRVSDHFCFTGNAHANAHDLLPIPYTEEAVRHFVQKIDSVQNFLGRKMYFENVSTYLRYKESEMTEWDFILEVSKRSGCGLLLDVNNVYVSAVNHNFDPRNYLDAIDEKRVGQIHLAGFSDMGTHLFDTHSKPVYPQVWELFHSVIKRMANVSVMIEWDEDIPEFSILQDEAMKAAHIWEIYHGKQNEFGKISKRNHKKYSQQEILHTR